MKLEALILKQKGMCETGRRLAQVFQKLESFTFAGMTTYDLDLKIRDLLSRYELTSQALGYKGFSGASCLSLNEEVVHGVPKKSRTILSEDLLKIDICASYNGYCADMARLFGIETKKHDVVIHHAREALDAGIMEAHVSKKVGDIGYSVQKIVEGYTYSTVKVFCGHGIGKKMHEEPQIPNWGKPGTGITLKVGMGLAIEPMFTLGKANILIESDGWTARTSDRSLAFHIEDTVFISENGPVITTQLT